MQIWKRPHDSLCTTVLCPKIQDPAVAFVRKALTGLALCRQGEQTCGNESDPTSGREVSMPSKHDLRGLGLVMDLVDCSA